jgi:histidinol-phosphatase (PHP family)
MIDYHVHSDYSQDAEGSVAEYCRKAGELGLTEICFTPHFEIDPVRVELDDKVRVKGEFVTMRSNWMGALIADIEQARREYSALKVRLGLEVGYDPTIEGEIADFLARYPFDYVIGSVHCIEHHEISSNKNMDFYYLSATLSQVVAGYFELLHRTIESGLFDAIGHLDVYKKYGLERYGTELQERAKPFWPGILRRIASRPPLTIEINTSGLRQGPAEPYPSEEILRSAYQTGLRCVTLGSDAHRLIHLGFGLEHGAGLATQIGFRIIGFERRRPVIVTS